MNKTELLVKISELLDKSIELYEIVDIKLEESDNGSLQSLSIYLDTAIEYLRKTRRTGRVVFNEYEDDLSIKPEYMQQDEDEDDDPED